MKIKLYLCRNYRLMRKVLIIGLSCVSIFLLTFFYYYNRWKVLWDLEDPKPIYAVEHHNDDTLRVVMIGDSWINILILSFLMSQEVKSFLFQKGREEKKQKESITECLKEEHMELNPFS